MKKAFIGTCVLLLLIGAASAQDTSFRGFYVGGYLGGVHGSADARTTVADDPAGYFATTSLTQIAAAGQQELNSKGFNAGGTVGYNWQPSRWVFGAEADFGALHVSDKRSSGPVEYSCAFCGGTFFNVTQQLRTNWLATVRPRVGYTWGRWMIFGTGGLAVAHVDYRERFTDTFANALESGKLNEALLGWTAGTGFEYQASRHWNLKGEYLFARFGDTSSTDANLVTGSTPWPNVFTHTTDLSTHIIRGGLNYRF
jgi:outer membrane immunogenic protein